MSSVCEVCGKRPGFGNNVPWSHKKTKRRWNPNLQTIRIATGSGDNKRRAKVCTSCIKANKVIKAG